MVDITPVGENTQKNVKVRCTSRGDNIKIPSPTLTNSVTSAVKMGAVNQTVISLIMHAITT